ncbi:hypothetical protein M427DRAFT_42769 [Gonapodya prolifera JEL478]|uniref:Uncharacterized protein n=1 Tax=Gonapodya prolifera (strain JEL478) TaxID=1344416 RepID=A0A139AMP7_GONPJ|nr:hypothetical protein M427DRAFT_42769 [Gonapodya prolifera JEL478]|eukprot:KXS18032.1 hypothetical protein M427DRAFT_42769 [Gonapodya prolifera JEL478]
MFPFEGLTIWSRSQGWLQGVNPATASDFASKIVGVSSWQSPAGPFSHGARYRYATTTRARATAQRKLLSIDWLCREAEVLSCVNSDEPYQRATSYLGFTVGSLDAGSASGLSMGAIVGIVAGAVVALYWWATQSSSGKGDRRRQTC